MRATRAPSTASTCGAGRGVQSRRLQADGKIRRNCRNGRVAAGRASAGHGRSCWLPPNQKGRPERRPYRVKIDKLRNEPPAVEFLALQSFAACDLDHTSSLSACYNFCVAALPGGRMLTSPIAGLLVEACRGVLRPQAPLEASPSQ